MDPKIRIRKQLDAAEATVKGLADLTKAIKRLEKKMDAIIAWIDEPEVVDGTDKSKR